MGILLGFLAAFSILGLIIAFFSRKLARGLNEARAINFSLMSSALIAAIVIPLVYGLEDTPDAVILLAVIGGAAGITIPWAMLFGEKFYAILRGKNPDRKELTTSRLSSRVSTNTDGGSTTTTTTTSDRN